MDKKHQDYIYIKENYYNEPKESFWMLKDLILQDFKNPSILDVGCSRGEFLYYISQEIECESLCGIDYSPTLIKLAGEFDGLKGVDFSVDSAEEFKLDRKFDVIVMSGVLSYFDDVSLTLARLKEHLNPNGKIYILGFFNHHDVDVRIQYKNNKYFDSFERGWNHHSLGTINRTLKTLDMQTKEIHKFNLSFDLAQQEDPCRGWHLQTEKGRKFINGVGLIYDMEVLEIQHKNRA